MNVSLQGRRGERGEPGLQGPLGGQVSHEPWHVSVTRSNHKCMNHMV